MLTSIEERGNGCAADEILQKQTLAGDEDGHKGRQGVVEGQVAHLQVRRKAARLSLCLHYHLHGHCWGRSQKPRQEKIKVTAHWLRGMQLVAQGALQSSPESALQAHAALFANGSSSDIMPARQNPPPCHALTSTLQRRSLKPHVPLLEEQHRAFSTPSHSALSSLQ